jgi:triosephosphate isomerase
MIKLKRYLIAGNWKMNVSSFDATQLVTEIAKKTSDITKVDILVCPPFTSIQAAKDAPIGSGSIHIGAQNFFPGKNGAYTGEISAIMLRELGVSHVIVGHSERREYFKEDNEFINRKIKCALSNNLIPILCVGEVLKERKQGKAFDRVKTQLQACLIDILPSMVRKLVIAYEPVWAIGTGETATPEIAQEMHAFIREQLKELFDVKTANAVRILYGGSMKEDNARDLLQEKDIDGGLVGGASLKATAFAEIVRLADALSN